MWKFYVGSGLALLAVLGMLTAIQLKGAQPVTRSPIYQPAASPSQDDNAMSNMRIP